MIHPVYYTHGCIFHAVVKTANQQVVFITSVSERLRGGEEMETCHLPLKDCPTFFHKLDSIQWEAD